MKGFKDPQGKFRPIENKKGVRMKRDSQKQVGIKLPRIDIRLPERKESYEQILSDVTRNNALRDNIIQKNEALAEKILANPTSEFNETWKSEIKENNKIVRDVNNDLRREIGKLTNEEKERLPDEIKNLRRFI